MSRSETTHPIPHLSVIIPCYNEAERIGASLRAIEQYLAAQPFVSEVIIVDDGSGDGTAEVARANWKGENFRVLTQNPNQGKGAAIRRGMIEAMGRWRLFTDADNSTPIEELDKFWPAAQDGAEALIASRAMPESELAQRQPFYREMMGRCFNGFVRVLALGGIHDTQCGFKLFSREAAEAVFKHQTLDGWAFDVECLMIARGLGYKIAEIPVRWINSPASRVNALTDSLQMFRDLWRLRRLYGRDGKRLKASRARILK